MNADSVVEYVVSSSLSLIKKIPLFNNGTIKVSGQEQTLNQKKLMVKL